MSEAKPWPIARISSWAIPWPCLHEFLAIVTHPRIYRPPTPLTRAFDQVDAWLASPTLKFDPEERQWADLSPKQRVLNKSRVPDIVDSEDDYLCASITASYKTAPAFVPFGQNAIRIL